MLHALELENFKAFGKRARIPFAPITLIFGENSAGKSTILQALYLLKQTRENRYTAAPLLPRAANGIVDLGSFQEMLFDHDLERTLSIRIEPVMVTRKLSEPSYTIKKIAIEFSFKKPTLEQEILLDQIGIYDGESSKCIAKFQPLGQTEARSRTRSSSTGIAYIDPFFRDPRALRATELYAIECVWLTTEPEYWKLEFKESNQSKGKILDDLKKRLNALKHSSEEPLKDDNESQKLLDSLKGYIEFFSSDFDLKTYISKRHEEEMDEILWMENFLPMIGDRGRWHFHDSYRMFDIPQLAVIAGRALDWVLGSFFSMGSFRRSPERWYIFTGTSPQHVGYQGDLLPDLLLRRPELVEETNEWLEKLNMGHKLTVKPVGNDSGDLFEVRLIDTRRNDRVSVALSDVGFGVSQLLPFIVQSLVAEEQIISIEQPEVHVHPKLQADLGDLLAEAIKEPRQNRFIVETHSEHLILRLQRLVRKKLLKPEDVSVIYVSRRPEGAKVERLHLDEDGDFIDEWPNGFFTERLREL